VLGHYSPGDNPQCSWPGCEVVDVDMLGIDHINNDGHTQRKLQGSSATGSQMYYRLKREGFPAGFQTLCMNHNTLKEILRRRNR
jgi:hypothetical protein